ncbi:hypothetical protein ZTR_07483 [Talaromyces verruculosus]|nr:hypothetical protein ZTR_07483 [Talaromyces verruculosus]
MDNQKDAAVELEHYEDAKVDAQVKSVDAVNDPEQALKERRIVRKLDMTLMPMIWLLYLFNYLDRNNIAQAKLNHFEEELGLKGDNFNTAVSILNVGYMLMQVPSNMLITPSTAGVKSYAGLVLVRLFLGVVEAPFFPGAFYLLSCWYTKKELALRTAILYSGLVIATAFSGLLAAAIFSGLDGARGLSGWKWLFIIEGAGSFFVSLFAFFLIPDTPNEDRSARSRWIRTGSNNWLFSEEEFLIAKERIIRDQVSNQVSENSVWHGLRLALLDYRVWVFSLILCSNHTAYGFNNFYPTIVKGLNLGNTTVTLACTAPPYLFATIFALATAYSSDHNKERGYHIAGNMALAIVGFVISLSTSGHPGVQYFASFLYITGAFSANALVYTWAAASVSQTPEKRACATAIINLMGQIGNIWSPYFFRPQDAPHYNLALILLIVFSAISILSCFAMKWTLRRDNKKLIEKFAEARPMDSVPGTELLDISSNGFLFENMESTQSPLLSTIIAYMK